MDVQEMDFPSVAIPAFSHFSNLVVFPASNEAQGNSRFFLLNKTAAVPKPSGEKVWIEYIPDSIYCLLPSSESKVGSVTIYSSRPDFLNDYSFCLEINKSSISCSNTVSDFYATPSIISKHDQKEDTSRGDEVPELKPLSNDEKCVRCRQCFVSHFPRPNTRLCKFNKPKSKGTKFDNPMQLRLRGGADRNGINTYYYIF